jgi:hypothetical protein
MSVLIDLDDNHELTHHTSLVGYAIMTNTESLVKSYLESDQEDPDVDLSPAMVIVGFCTSFVTRDNMMKCFEGKVILLASEHGNPSRQRSCVSHLSM